jgi:stage II sporulation protein D
VLLQRSPQTIALGIKTPAYVRLDGVVGKARLSAGKLYFSRVGEKIQIVRLPYRPLTAQSIELLWPVDKPGFEWEGSAFRGRARVQQAEGDLFLVNALPLEAYLASTVGTEMTPTWNLEALKAQAIAARSYALYRQTHPRHALYDLERTTEDQAYSGLRGETSRTWEAIRATVGLHLTDQGKPTVAYYHSRCGGETETPHQVWNNANSSRPRIPCPFCRQFPFRWKASWSAENFLAKIGLAPTGELKWSPVSRSSQGRLYEIEVSNGLEKTRLGADRLRRLLGYQTLKSSNFQLSTTPQGVEVEGVGAGHGVGMCQWGAKYFAEKGFSFRKILGHYYPQYSLKKEGENLFAARGR